MKHGMVREWRDRAVNMLPVPRSATYMARVGGTSSGPIAGDMPRLLLVVACAAAGFALGVGGWRAMGLGATVTGPALVELEAHVREARAAVARLPGLQRAVHERQAATGATQRKPTAHWQAIAKLAARSGVTLRSLDPGAVAGSGPAAVRQLRLTAQGNFAGFYAFLSGLPKLPLLAVPAGMRVERDAAGLTFEASLDVFESLPGTPDTDVKSSAAGDEGQVWFADPFALTVRGAGGDVRDRRLIGLMRGDAKSAHALAFFESDGAAAAYAPGELVDGKRLVRIDAHGVALASGDGTHVLTLDREAS